MKAGALGLLVLALAACGGGIDDVEQQVAVGAAKSAYARARAEGIDLTSGPCVADSLPGLPDWVADVAHDPRQAVDDRVENQCARYRAGKAHHFVELDPQGSVIRAK